MTAAYLFSADFSDAVDRSHSARRGRPDAAEPLLVDERALLARLRSGDESAFTALFVAHTDHMYRVAAALLGSRDAAADVVQGVMYRLWLRRDRLEVRGTFGAYLRTATINAARNALRDAERGRVRAEQAAIALGAAAEHPDENDDELTSRRVAALETAIAGLPARTREIFLLWWAGELSYAEIAQSTGISVKGVERARARALNALRAALIAQGLGPAV